MKNNDEIKVGEYVRTNNSKGIRRIDEINENAPMNRYLSFEGYDHNDKIYSIIRVDDIKGHSTNLVDLIEVGDYVNGYKVKDIRLWNTFLNGNHEYNLYFGELGTMKSGEIKSIVTHEQFDKMKFEVNEKC